MWLLRAVIHGSQPLLVLFFGAGLNDVKPRLVHGHHPGGEAGIQSAFPKKVLAKLMPLSAVLCCQVVWYKFSTFFLQIQVLVEEAQCRSMRNSKRI